MFAGLCRDRANPGGVVIAICFNNAICSGLYRLRLRARHIKLRIPLPITTKWSVTGNLHHLQGRALALENLHILIELGQAQFAKLLICREVIIIRPFAPCLQRNAMPSPDFAVLYRRMREKEKRRLLTFHFGKKQDRAGIRSEVHTSELQTLMRTSYSVY